MKVYDGSSQTEQSQDAEPERVKVGIAEYEVTADGAVLTTSGLGSCIGLALYDPGTGIAGLVHVMLPSADDMEDGNAAKFADTGTDLLVELRDAGVPVTGFNVRAPTLDDVFLAITGEHVDTDPSTDGEVAELEGSR